ncbi:unnamed protein product [Leptidea sinapis]|uniref:Uncharacterized protein n=1 Tax=Leptidea sinapis TaxID=189913 RepID=A0A5E4PQD0_9NEOP|nr:unnamed protein product [Leptidea sinapis]
MTYAFIIVVSVAITLKLLFMSLSLYFTLKYDSPEKSEAGNTKRSGKGIMAKCKQITRAFMPKVSCYADGKDKYDLNIYNN